MLPKSGVLKLRKALAEEPSVLCQGRCVEEDEFGRISKCCPTAYTFLVPESRTYKVLDSVWLIFDSCNHRPFTRWWDIGPKSKTVPLLIEELDKWIQERGNGDQSA